MCDIPECTTAFSSILQPGQTLLVHTGANYGVLRYHLAIRVPVDEQTCSLVVGRETRHWHYGQDLLFDDTLPHSASNTSDEVRVVLFIDVLRPMHNICRSRIISLLHWLIAPNTRYV